MEYHLSEFTPTGVQAFVRRLADSARECREAVEHTRAQTESLRHRTRMELEALAHEGHERARRIARQLASFGAARREQEAARRKKAGGIAEDRHIDVTELRSDISALLGRFHMSRQAVAADLRKVAEEIRQTGLVWHGRNKPAAGGASRRSAKK